MGPCAAAPSGRVASEAVGVTPMDQEILTVLTRIAEALDGLRKDQQAVAAALLEGVGDVERAVRGLGDYLDQATDSLLEIQFQTTPGGDPREPMPS
jgi:hypothetical protein